VRVTARLEGRKREFESSEEFNARLARGAGGGRRFVFLCDNMPLSVTYDADQKAFLFKETDYPPWLIVKRLQRTSYYPGRNSFGVKTTVKKITAKEYALYPGGLHTEATLPVSSSREAKALKKDLRVGLVVVLEPGFSDSLNVRHPDPEMRTHTSRAPDGIPSQRSTFQWKKAL
jgi:hypothetical protein